MWTYDPAPERTVAMHLKPRYHPFVDGEDVAGPGVRPALDPAADAPLAEVGTAGPAEVDRAVEAARRARDGAWGAMSGADRARCLFRVARVVEARAYEVALLESAGSGRPVRTTRDVDLPAVLAHLRFFAGWADKLEHAGQGPDPRPLGVVGALVAGDAPLRAAVERIAPALAAGNAVVVAPDPDAPLSALVLASAAAEAGLPAGVLNVVPDAGDVLAGHAGLDALAVTGSAGACRAAAQRRRGRRFVATRTGRTVHVVHDDAPLDQAADGVVDGLGTDQRVLVAEAVADEFGELLRERVGRLRVGHPLDRNVDVGPVRSRDRRDRALALLAAADDEGARRWTSPAALPDDGLFLAPAVILDVAPTSTPATAEVTGPLVPVLTFRTPPEAVALAAGARAAAVWCDKGSRALWTARRMRAPVVWVNAVGLADPATGAGPGLAEHLAG